MSRLRRGGFVAAALFILAILLCASEALADGPRERDIWYIFVARDQPYGHFHVTVRRQEDGKFRYDVDSRLLMDFLGQKQEITEKATYVVTAEYAPVSLVSESTSRSGSGRLRGRVEGEQFVLGYERAGLRRTASIDLSERPIFHVCLPDWLAETRFIKPSDPDIVRQAREWIGDEKTALGAVRVLSSAVARHMQGGTMIVETLSGPEVLRSKQGKCSEYATLFASLARSAGIPTRIVLGMRLMTTS